ncbi:MAG: purine-nucleoside phosphorylase, partial [Actinomycetota bacterium]
MSHQVAVVLGSGLSAVAESLTHGTRTPYAEIESMPPTTVPGHEGALYSGEVSGVPTLAFAGRLHLYEGHDARVVTQPIRLAADAGCETIVLTCAAGAINPKLEVGAPCLISDHINLTGANPLKGEPHFLDLSNLYDAELRALARSADPDLKEGVYAGLVGPTYETPAEVRMLATLGADLVGMSTVLEAIAARAFGARVLGIAVVSNLAAGLLPT